MRRSSTPWSVAVLLLLSSSFSLPAAGNPRLPTQLQQCSPAPSNLTANGTALADAGNSVTVLALLQATCPFCLRQALWLNVLGVKLAEKGLKVNYAIVNNLDASPRLSSLEEASPVVPVFQETADEPIWSQLRGRKDDFYVFDRCGRLAYYIPLPFSFLSRNYVEAAIMNTHDARPCGYCRHDPKRGKQRSPSRKRPGLQRQQPRRGSRRFRPSERNVTLDSRDSVAGENATLEEGFAQELSFERDSTEFASENASQRFDDREFEDHQHRHENRSSRNPEDYRRDRDYDGLDDLEPNDDYHHRGLDRNNSLDFSREKDMPTHHHWGHWGQWGHWGHRDFNQSSDDSQSLERETENVDRPPSSEHDNEQTKAHHRGPPPQSETDPESSTVRIRPTTATEPPSNHRFHRTRPPPFHPEAADSTDPFRPTRKPYHREFPRRGYNYEPSRFDRNNRLHHEHLLHHLHHLLQGGPTHPPQLQSSPGTSADREPSLEPSLEPSRRPFHPTVEPASTENVGEPNEKETATVPYVTIPSLYEEESSVQRLDSSLFQRGLDQDQADRDQTDRNQTDRVEDSSKAGIDVHSRRWRYDHGSKAGNGTGSAADLSWSEFRKNMSSALQMMWRRIEASRDRKPDHVDE